MSISAFLGRVMPAYRRVFLGPDPQQPDVRLPLRTELFLAAHNDETGRAHIGLRALCLGLAGAILLELWLTGRVLIGYAYRVRENDYIPDPGRILILNSGLCGDPLTDAAMTQLNRTGGQIYLTDFIREFATLDLYDRVKGDMLATGVLHRDTSRRRRIFRRDGYLPVKKAYSVRVRTWLRDLASSRHPGNSRDLGKIQTFALAGLVAALGLTRNLFHSDPAWLHGRLMDGIAGLYDSTIRDVHAAVNPANRRYVH